MLIWQARSDRFSRYLAANIAADVLKKQPSKATSALEPLALHYLRSYLAIPVSDEELNSLGYQFREADPSPDAEQWFALRPNSELQDILKEALLKEATPTPAPGATQASSEPNALPTPISGKIGTNHPLYSHIYFGEVMFHHHRQVIPKYVHMIKEHARANATSDSARAAHLKRRTELANGIIKSWDQWIALISNGPVDADLNFRLQALAGMSATYTRAQLYAQAADKEATPSLVSSQSGALDRTIHRRIMVDMVQGYVRPRSGRFYQYHADKNFLQKEQLLLEFETKLVELAKVYATNVNDANGAWAAARPAASIAARLGLFSCKSQASVDSGPILKTCGQDDEPESFIWTIREMSPRLTTDKRGDPWSNFLKESLSSGLPVT